MIILSLARRIKLHFRQMVFLVETLHIFRKAFVLVLKSSHGLHLNKKEVREESSIFYNLYEILFALFLLFIDIQYLESNFYFVSNNNYKNLNRHIITYFYYISFFYLIILIIELYWINENTDNFNECNIQLIK